MATWLLFFFILHETKSTCSIIPPCTSLNKMQKLYCFNYNPILLISKQLTNTYKLTKEKLTCFSYILPIKTKKTHLQYRSQILSNPQSGAFETVYNVLHFETNNFTCNSIGQTHFSFFSCNGDCVVLRQSCIILISSAQSHS